MAEERMEKWRDMGDAPKDGTEMLVYSDGTDSYAIVHWDDEYGKYPWCEAEGVCHSQYWPTSWMPLPTPPERSD